MRNIYSRLGPDEEIKKCLWYKEKKEEKIERFDRVKYSIQGGLKDEFVKKKLNFDIEDWRIIRDLTKKLNKYTHITEKVFDIDYSEGKNFVFQSIQSLLDLFKEIKIFRSELERKYEEILYNKLIDTFISETFEDLDIIATHYIVKSFQIEHIKIIGIDYEKAKVKIEGTLVVEHQWGSNYDMKNDIGAIIENSYPFEINTQIDVKSPLNFNIEKHEIIIDDFNWYN